MRKLSIADCLEPLLVSIGLVLLVSYRFFEPIWTAAPGLLALGGLTSVAYLAGFVTVRRSRETGTLRVLLIGILVSQPVLLATWLLGLPLSRIALVLELFILFLALLLTASRVPPRARAGVATLFAAVAAYPSVAGGLEAEGERSLPAVAEDFVFSSYHDLSVTDYTVLEGEKQSGGAVRLLPDGRVLLVAGSGASRILSLDDGLEATEVDLDLPIDVATYRARASSPTPYYRVTDVIYHDGRLLVSYTAWHSEDDCYTVRLVEASFDGVSAGPWTTRFDSRPCLELGSLNNRAGGRIAVLDSAHVLLTLGAFGSTSDDGADYGKIVRLDTESWRSEVFTRGHRNAQGLLVSDTVIWSTEHGPDGGDELNRIEAGRDYGWPAVSYGTDYGRKTLSSGNVPGDHSGFEEPVFTWVPSVGISDLIEVSGSTFPLWEGDLLIGSLSGLGNGHSLFRVRLVEGRAVTVERIPTGRLIRDLVELPNGLLLWDGRGTLQLVRAGGHVFSPCSSCHAVRLATHGVGPDLWGVVGSPVARHADYEYSRALKEYGGRWTKTRLDRFLENPSGEIPGTTMEHDGISDPGERAEIIRFLEDVRDR